MASTKYTYSIADDFLPGTIEPDLVRLGETIDADPGIVTEKEFLTYHEAAGTAGEVDVWFVDALSGPEETALDAIIAGFVVVVDPPREPAFDVNSVLLELDGKVIYIGDGEILLSG